MIRGCKLTIYFEEFTMRILKTTSKNKLNL